MQRSSKRRTLLLAAALLGVALAAVLQHAPRTPAEADRESSSLFAWAERTRPMLYANHPVSTDDSVSEGEALRRVGRLYRLQADLLEARAQADHDRLHARMDEAMRALRDMLRRPGFAERPRFRDAFRTITEEYRDLYGVPDTLSLPRGRIYDLRRGAFAALNHDRAPDLEAAREVPLRLMDTEVPMTINEKVRASMAFLLDHRERYLHPWLRRSATYFPMIEQVLAEENVPDELKYLALVESGLDPHAHSHARAAGIWQFVAETGRRYGLTVDPWVDERRDPEKSTRAAAQHLRDLYELFGDWQLALAGYNCNPAAVRHALREARARLDRRPTFWDIYDDLPAETRNYVPLYIATAVIISNPAAFDLKRVAPGPRYAFDHVPVREPMTIEQVAALAEADVKTVRWLNPELRGRRLPPSEHPYYVRLPYGSYATFAENHEALPDAERPAAVRHVVRPGETAGRVAERYHVDRPSLLRANAVQPQQMAVGQQWILPSTRYAGNAAVAGQAGMRPVRVRYGSRTTRPVAIDAPPASPPSEAGTAGASGPAEVASLPPPAR